MSRNIIFTDVAFNDYVYWQTQDKKTLIRINKLIEDIIRNGNKGIGKPEPLKGNFSGSWSRRIDEKNRLIYRIEGEVVFILACKTHYDEK